MKERDKGYRKGSHQHQKKKKKKKEVKWRARMYHERSNEDKIENHGDTTIIFNTASSKLC
jgi:hypothetical protein